MTQRSSQWSFVHLAALAALSAALAPAAFAQSKPQGVQPTSQGPNQSTPPASSTPQGSPQNPPAQAAPPPSAPAPSSSPATTYTAPDGSASVLLPTGWKVGTASQGVIVMTGAQTGEAAILGERIGALNGPFVPGQHSANALIAMPYSADFSDKVAMVVDQLQVLNGKPLPQGSVSSVTPIPVPRDLGQCGRFSGTMSSPNGDIMATGTFCSMPLEAAGGYRNILVMIQAPATESATFTQLAQSIMSTYTVQPATLQDLLRPYDQIAGRPIQLLDPASSACFNLSVLRLTPAAQLPRACGGSAP